MAKKIIGSVRVNRTLFKEGQEDELAAAASPAELARLEERGVISGFAGSKSKSVAAAESEDAEDEPKGKKKEK